MQKSTPYTPKTKNSMNFDKETIAKIHHDYLSGMMPSQLAKKYGKTTTQMKNLVSYHRWSKEKRNLGIPFVNIPDNERPHPAKHGAYTSVLLDNLSEEEQQMINTLSDDPEELILQQIKLYKVRVFRIMKAQRMLLDAPADTLFHTSTATVTDKDGNKKLVIRRAEICTSAYLRTERELSRIMGKLDQAIKMLHDIRMQKQYAELLNDNGDFASAAMLKLELLDARIEQIDAKTALLLGENSEIEDLSAAENMIYNPDSQKRV